MGLVYCNMNVRRPYRVMAALLAALLAVMMVRFMFVETEAGIGLVHWYALYCLTIIARHGRGPRHWSTLYHAILND